MLPKKHVVNKLHFLPYAEGYWCNEPGEPHEASNVFLSMLSDTHFLFGEYILSKES